MGSSLPLSADRTTANVIRACLLHSHSLLIFTLTERHITMLYRLIKLALLFGLLLTGKPAHAQGNSIRQGMLTCRTSASVGLILGSTQRLACQFKANSGWTQNYDGRINR